MHGESPNHQIFPQDVVTLSSPALCYSGLNGNDAGWLTSYSHRKPPTMSPLTDPKTLHVNLLFCLAAYRECMQTITIFNSQSKSNLPNTTRGDLAEPQRPWTHCGVVPLLALPPQLKQNGEKQRREQHDSQLDQAAS